jgi:hypothetical protein
MQFSLSSTCFEHLMFLIRKPILYMQPYVVCKQSVGWKDVLNNMFETCRR